MTDKLARLEAAKGLTIPFPAHLLIRVESNHFSFSDCWYDDKLNNDLRFWIQKFPKKYFIQLLFPEIFWFIWAEPESTRGGVGSLIGLILFLKLFSRDPVKRLADWIDLTYVKQETRWTMYRLNSDFLTIGE